MGEKRVPKLRFPEFGEEWKSEILRNLTKKLNVGFVGTCERFYTSQDQGVLLIRTGNLKDSGLNLTDVKYVELSFHNSNKKSQVFPGDLLIARHGVNGHAALVPEQFKEANCLNIVIIRTKGSLDSYFLMSQFNSEILQSQVHSRTAGSTQGVINTGELAKLRISLTTLPEQKKIADFLSAVDKKIEQLTRKKELLEQYKKGVMQKLFPAPGQKHPELRFKQEDGSDFPDWEVKKLGEVALINPKSAKLPDRFIYIDLESVEKGKLLKHTWIKSNDAPSRAQRVLNKGDILFQTVRPYQKNNLLFLYQGSYVASTGYAQLKPKEDRSFIFHYLHHQPVVNLTIRWSTGTSFPAIGAKDLASLKLSIPHIQEQKVIGSFVVKLSEQIHELSKVIDNVKIFKKGLLQQMFV